MAAVNFPWEINPSNIKLARRAKILVNREKSASSKEHTCCINRAVDPGLYEQLHTMLEDLPDDDHVAHVPTE